MLRRLVLLIAFTALSASFANAEITKGPYLQNMDRNGVTICFETNVAGAGTVYWGVTDAYGQQATSDPFELNIPSYIRYQHKIRIENLDMDNMYHYKISHSGDESANYAFTTYPDTIGSQTFLIYGDSRGGDVGSPNLQHEAVIAAMANEGGSLFLNSGDLIGSGEDLYNWEYMFHSDKDFMATTVLYPSFGNHEDGFDMATGLSGDINWGRLFDTGEPTHATYYSFDYANVHFVVLDVEKWFSLLTPASSQMAWLIEDINTAQNDPHTNFIIAMWHEPAFTWKEGRTPNPMVLLVLEPFLRDKVDAVFCGHDHFYARADRGGVPHVVTGGGGAGLYDFIANPQSRRGYRYHEKVNHYIRAALDPQQIVFEAVRVPDMTILDTFTVTSDVMPVSHETAIDDDDDDDDGVDDDDSDDDDSDDDDSDDDDANNDDDDDDETPQAGSDDSDDDDSGCCG